MTRPPNPELVDSILTITTDLIAEKGAANVTLREIADLAGVTTTTVHYYFENRAGLFEAAKLRAVDELDATITAGLDHTATATEQVKAITGAFVSWSLANPHAFALVFEALPAPTELDAEFTRRSYASFDRLREVYALGRDTGEFAIADVDLEATFGFAVVYGAVELALNRRLPPRYWADPTPVFEHAVEGILGALHPQVRDGGLRPATHAGRALRDDELDLLSAAGEPAAEHRPPQT